MTKRLERFFKSIIDQFANGCQTEYGEPQAFIELSNGRSIEVTKEMEGLEKDKYYYSVRLHCSDEEFDNDVFHPTCGVIGTYCSQSLRDSDLLDCISSVICCDKKFLNAAKAN